MITAKLKGTMREKKGKGICRRLRQKHVVPGVLYGREKENMLVEFSEMDIIELIKNYGENAVVELEIGDFGQRAMIKEVQRDPVNRNINHLDMKYLDNNEKVHVDVPLVLKGEDMIKTKGGVVQKQISCLSVEGFPDSIPKVLVADVSNLDLGGKLKVSDMEFSSELSVADDYNSIVAVVTPL